MATCRPSEHARHTTLHHMHRATLVRGQTTLLAAPTPQFSRSVTRDRESKCFFLFGSNFFSQKESSNEVFFLFLCLLWNRPARFQKYLQLKKILEMTSDPLPTGTTSTSEATESSGCFRPAPIVTRSTLRCSTVTAGGPTIPSSSITDSPCSTTNGTRPRSSVLSPRPTTTTTNQRSTREEQRACARAVNTRSGGVPNMPRVRFVAHV